MFKRVTVLDVLIGSSVVSVLPKYLEIGQFPQNLK